MARLPFIEENNFVRTNPKKLKKSYYKILKS